MSLTRLGVRSPGFSVDALILGGIVALAALLRFRGLGSQSYWFDEVLTREEVRGSLSRLLNLVQANETNPPFYYVVAWVWRHLFGLSEVGLRSLSAVVGTAAIPLVWLCGRELASRSGALAAAAIVAVNPMLIWYSQEARSYSLVVMLSALSLWLCLRARRVHTRAALWWWSASAVLLPVTHYIGAFIVLSEGAALLWLLPDRRRSVLLAAAPIALVGAALTPLAHSQAQGGRASAFASWSLAGRVGDIVHELLTGNTGLVLRLASQPAPPYGPWGAITLTALIGGVAGVLAFGEKAMRRRAVLPLAIGLGALIVPILLGVGPLDYVWDRNLIAAWIPLAVALGVALASVRRAAVWSLGAIMLAGIAVSHQVATNASMQRTAWRQATVALGQPATARAVIIYPAYDWTVLDTYGLRLVPMPAGAQVSEVDLVGPGVPPASAQLRLPPGFLTIERRQVQRVSVNRFAPAFKLVYTSKLINAAGGDVYLEPSPAGWRWVTTYFALLTRWRSDLAANGARARQRLLAAPIIVRALVRPPPELPTAPTLLRLTRRAARAAVRYARDGSAQSRARFAHALKDMAKQTVLPPQPWDDAHPSATSGSFRFSRDFP